MQHIVTYRYYSKIIAFLAHGAHGTPYQQLFQTTGVETNASKLRFCRQRKNLMPAYKVLGSKVLGSKPLNARHIDAKGIGVKALKCQAH